jgi:hypothetical protein
VNLDICLKIYTKVIQKIPNIDARISPDGISSDTSIVNLYFTKPGSKIPIIRINVTTAEVQLDKYTFSVSIIGNLDETETGSVPFAEVQVKQLQIEHTKEIQKLTEQYQLEKKREVDAEITKKMDDEKKLLELRFSSQLAEKEKQMQEMKIENEQRFDEKINQALNVIEEKHKQREVELEIHHSRIEDENKKLVLLFPDLSLSFIQTSFGARPIVTIATGLDSFPDFLTL